MLQQCVCVCVGGGGGGGAGAKYAAYSLTSAKLVTFQHNPNGGINGAQLDKILSSAQKNLTIAIVF